jgi:hypothetical protein
MSFIRSSFGVCSYCFRDQPQSNLVCASIEGSYPGRADHGHNYNSNGICWAYLLGNFMAKLSAGGFTGKGPQTVEKGGIKKRP